MAHEDRYTELAEVLATAGAPLPLAELHGGVCGALCIGGMNAAREWIETAVRDCDADPPEAARLREQLEGAALDTWRALASSDLDFQPLLPHEDDALEERVGAVASWCQGFLAGLALGGFQLVERAREPDAQDGLVEEDAAAGEGAATDEADADAEVAEIVSDFAEISNAGLHAREVSERVEAEFDLAQVTEYVRVGAQTIYEELAQRHDPDPNARVH